MSKAFDTINRLKLMNMIKDYTFRRKCDLVELLYTKTTLSEKIGKRIGRELSTIGSAPQGDGFSPKIFDLCLHHVFRQVTERFSPNDKHNCCSRPDLLLFVVEYADDVDFFLNKPDEDVAELITEVLKFFGEFDLILKEEMTEIPNLTNKKHLTGTKTPGSILVDHANFRRRNQLNLIPLRTYNFIWIHQCFHKN